jgi:hypothetical protein
MPALVSPTPERGPSTDGPDQARSSERTDVLARRDEVMEIASIGCPVNLQQAKPGVSAKQTDDVVFCKLLGTRGKDDQIYPLGPSISPETIRRDDRFLDHRHVGFGSDRLLNDFAQHPRYSKKQDSDDLFSLMALRHSDEKISAHELRDHEPR